MEITRHLYVLIVYVIYTVKTNNNSNRIIIIMNRHAWIETLTKYNWTTSAKHNKRINKPDSSMASVRRQCTQHHRPWKRNLTCYQHCRRRTHYLYIVSLIPIRFYKHACVERVEPPGRSVAVVVSYFRAACWAADTGGRRCLRVVVARRRRRQARGWSRLLYYVCVLL